MVVSYLKIRVVIFTVSHPSDSIDKGHGLVIIFELKIFEDFLMILAGLPPLCQLLQMLIDGIHVERWNASFTGKAMFTA
jgi:hypothetical protein